MYQPVWATLAILAGLLGLGLRWQFASSVRLYPDEFVTLLAMRMIGETGLPLMPSGLFYDHGLLYSYLGSLVAGFEASPLAARYVSLVCGGLTLGLTFWLGRRWFSPAAGLLALTALAVAPAAIHWSGRARMYALLQLLVLLALWWAYQGLIAEQARWRWLALAAYLGATLTHFVAVALAPPLLLAALLLLWLQARSGQPNLWLRLRRLWPELLALGGILVIAFLVKRAGQPKGIDALEITSTSALTGLAQVLAIYSDLSLDVLTGWQALAPFYLTPPALLFAPFALLAVGVSGAALVWPNQAADRDVRPCYAAPLFLGAVLLTTTLEMMLVVSPDRRDDKYLFMLLPALFLLGAQGMVLAWRWLLSRLTVAGWSAWEPLLAGGVSLGIVAASWPAIQALLTNLGDDYEAAFAYVQAHWREGDAILTGTPAAAAFYLGRNDFYSVQRRGGYDYRILNVAGQPVDRWLASPAIRTEAALQQVLADNAVWLVLERWGLQREYYDLPFQQQLLAQTDYVTETQGIFVLRSKSNPQPILLQPAHPVEAVFGGVVELLGYTTEPAQGAPGQPLRLTLYWQAVQPLAHDYTVFVHLRRPGEAGNVAQADHRPLGSLYPTSLWPVGETIRETSALDLPPDLSPGEYDLWAGMYLLETGERLPLENDRSGENAVRLGKLTVGN